MTATGQPAEAPPFGAYAPGAIDRLVMTMTTRLPANWLGLRLAIGLRRLSTMRLGDGALDVVRWGMRLRLRPGDNACEKQALFTPQIYDHIELMEIDAEIARARSRGNAFVFVDIGANVGLYSIFVAARAGPRAQIVAVEPDPTNFSRLCFNIAANPGLPIHAVALAIGEEAGELAIMPNRDDRGGTRTRKAGAPTAAIGELRVPCRALTDLLAQEGITAIDAMKIDVEGSEPAVIAPFFRDAPITLWPRLVVMEDSSHEWPIDLFGLLAASGYRFCGRSRHNVILRRDGEAAPAGDR